VTDLRGEVPVLVSSLPWRVEGQHEEVAPGAELDLEVGLPGADQEALQHVVVPEIGHASADRCIRHS
jgi:hypothetical protein